MGGTTKVTPPTALVDQLVGWFWQIKSTTIHGVTTVAPSGSWGAINFSRNDLDASDDQGSDYSSYDSVTYEASTIIMRSMAVAGGASNGSRLQAAYVAVLRDRAKVTIVGKTLTMSAHGGVLVYTRAHAAPYKDGNLAPIPQGPPGPPSASVRAPAPVASPSRAG